MLRRHLGRRAVGLVLAGAASGCGSVGSPFSQTLGLVFSPDSAAAVAQAKLNPALRYLRAQADGQVSLLVLGYLEPHADGDIEVWYSRDRIVLRIQNGRLVGTTGLATDWRRVSYIGAPPWAQVGDRKLNYWRERDEWPGYRFNIREELELRPVAPPKNSHWQGETPAGLRWFEELAHQVGDGSPLPPSRYAVVGHEVLYAETCLTDERCLIWQRWPTPARSTP